MMNTKTFFAIIGNLTFKTALHIGTGKGYAGTDSPFRRNEEGKIILPATALAGHLRSTATYLLADINLPGSKRSSCLALTTENKVCGCPVCHLFGEVNPGEKDDPETGGRASRLWMFDSHLKQGSDLYIRDNVGIDRVTGAAARAGRVKFDQEILPAGAAFTFHLELEESSEMDQILLAAVLSEWMAGRVWLGGGKGRGLGNAVLSDVACLKNGLADAKDLLAYLKSDDLLSSAQSDTGWLSQQTTLARSYAKSDQFPFVEIEFNLNMDGLFLTQDTTLASITGFDHASLIDGIPDNNKNLKPVMPGSGIRGVLRSHAEKIARTLATNISNKDNYPTETFLRICPACNPLQDNANLPLAKCSEINQLEQGAKPTEKDLCLACQLFGNAQSGSRLRIADAPLEGEPIWKAIDFLAIDRFTGGGLNGAKFDAVALWRPTFHVRIFLEKPEEWELGWMAHVIRDLQEGRLPFGFGPAKGFGQAKASDIFVRCGFLSDTQWGHLASEHEVKDNFGFYRLAQFSDHDWNVARSQVLSWLKAFNEKVKAFSRQEGNLAILRSDSYFESNPDGTTPSHKAKIRNLYPIISKEVHHE